MLRRSLLSLALIIASLLGANVACAEWVSSSRKDTYSCPKQNQEASLTYKPSKKNGDHVMKTRVELLCDNKLTFSNEVPGEADAIEDGPNDSVKYFIFLVWKKK